jgi:hypothetical protein
MKRLAAIFLLAPLLLTGCVVPYGGSTPTATTVTPPAGAKTFATLDAAGIKQIKASKTARFDMTTGWLRKASGLRTEQARHRTLASSTDTWN